jgi:hypothetical protein
MFTEAQRDSIGVCVSQLDELVESLKRLGVAPERLAPITAAIEDLEAATAAHRPAPPKNAVLGALSQMRVLEEEMRPSRMAAYGDISAASAAVLDRHVQKLADLTDQLIGSLRLRRA